MNQTLTKLIIENAGGGKHCLLVAGATLGILAPFQAAQASVIFNQTANFPNGIASASQNNPMISFRNFATVYDNFSFSSNNLVNGINWVGGYFNPQAAAPISSFALSIFDGNGDQPGSLLFSETITGNAGETFIGTNNGGSLIYSYSASLTGSFLAQEGETYWLAIVPTFVPTPGFLRQWGWYTSPQGDGVSYQDFLGNRRVITRDFAFSLTGEPVPDPSPDLTGEPVSVPEPSAMLGLLNLGLLGIGSKLKQKR